MQADNPTLILQTLDARLDHEVELTLIGKSALWLGFDDAPAHYGVTQDVDAVVPARQSEQGLTRPELEAAFAVAHVPDDADIISAFAEARECVLERLTP